ncbi:MAG TPA: toxic anion resistance protein [Bacillota bacterium]|nr:toxic anion resistance protein [Clostridiales bacterium]HPT85332.1 toxic anion resistance protein [Bacillota bacterium]
MTDTPKYNLNLPPLKLETDPELTKPDLSEDSLTEEEKRFVEQIVNKINIADVNSIMNYGEGVQAKVAEFSDSALSNIRVMDLGEAGEMITQLITQLRGFEVDENQKGLRALFSRGKNKLEALKVKYEKTETAVEKIIDSLENHQIQLRKDIAMLEKLYEVNLQNFKELTLYIIAGKRKLEEARRTTLRELVERAAQTGLAADAQAANDFAALCDRFEKKLHDLELTRNVALQMGPQIRMVQNNDAVMCEKIHSTIVNTVPLWKSQMVIALGLAHSQQALQAQRAVTDMTNELLRKNAEALKAATVQTAREAERGIVDIETLKATNEALISTLDEVLAIQNEGREKRRVAQEELARIEEQLKNKLLEIHGIKNGQNNPQP